MAVADLGGAPGANPPSPRPKIFSISCSFSRNLANHMLAPPGGLAPPPMGNPGSAPAWDESSFDVNFSINPHETEVVESSLGSLLQKFRLGFPMENPGSATAPLHFSSDVLSVQKSCRSLGSEHGCLHYSKEMFLL